MYSSIYKLNNLQYYNMIINLNQSFGVYVYR